MPLVCSLSPSGLEGDLFPPNLSPQFLRSYELGEVQEVSAGDPFIRMEAGFGFRLFEVVSSVQPPSFSRVPLSPWPPGKVLMLKASSANDPNELYLEDPETLAWVSVSSDGRILRGWVSPVDATAIETSGWPGDFEVRESGEVLKTERSSLGVLLYTGISGNTLRVTYMEYPQGAAGPSSSEDLEFDLSRSRTISFKSLEIEILEANSSSITFRVLSDGDLPWLVRR